MSTLDLKGSLVVFIKKVQQLYFHQYWGAHPKEVEDMFFLLLLHRFNREVFNACVLAIGVHITCIMYVCKYQQNQQTD